MEEQGKNGRGQGEPSAQESPETTEPEKGAPSQGVAVQPTTLTTTEKVPTRWRVLLGWGLSAVLFVIAIALATQLLKEKQVNAKLSEQIEQLQSAVFSARKVFLERTAAELGYASIDLQADPPKRYQVAFRLDEASRWLRDAEPLLSENGRFQAQNLQQALRQLLVLVEQDPTSARQELAKIQGLLERLMNSETQLP
ncbi:MAG: hypothetical protein ACUVTP_11215 [Candidatus Fervidibacter sp.]|uniref:hypothetical protein n=1 Tax=Candidatus Fervidibacter sp. TaxID=3100871 RepID=UPI00404B65FB